MLYKMSKFWEPARSKNEIKVELHLSNYATKSNLKHATDVFTSRFAKKTDLAGLKLDIVKQETFSIWL